MPLIHTKRSTNVNLLAVASCDSSRVDLFDKNQTSCALGYHIGVLQELSRIANITVRIT